MESLNLESYFQQYRKHIIGLNNTIVVNGKSHPMIYADWTASGRLYRPIEETMLNMVGPWVANTHTETSMTGATMTRAYAEARQQIKRHVNAGREDILITCGNGMTGALAKLLRILGLYVPRHFKGMQLPETERPVVFLSHMEHHSNHTAWMETICEVVVIPHDMRGLINLAALEHMLAHCRDRTKYVSVTACSNVTGIKTPYRTIAAIAHKYGGYCFVDFACSAPYVDIDMHHSDTDYLDAIVFSPHKFLGGPGSTGVLIFNRDLYHNQAPDIPGGGTVIFTAPWGKHLYKSDIEEREDGGTPGFLQTIRAALAIRLKEAMGTNRIYQREMQMNRLVFEQLEHVKGLTLLASEHKNRQSIFSLTIEGLHHDLVIRLLNDRFGIQARGGCSCAGTYGHFLMRIGKKTSHRIKGQIMKGCIIDRPGWVRISFHPTNTDHEVLLVCHALRCIVDKKEDWANDYLMTAKGFKLKNKEAHEGADVESWFEMCCKSKLDLKLS